VKSSEIQLPIAIAAIPTATRKGQCDEYTGRFITFSVITNIYNKKTKGPTLMELFTATGKLIFLQLQKYDVCTTSVKAHIDTIFKFFSG